MAARGDGWRRGAFLVASPTAPGAAAELTEALATGPLRVRMGLHTGTPLVSAERYVGEDVHRAARIAAAWARRAGARVGGGGAARAL